ncbi:hypothetical protein GBK02_03195 [Dechloromonas sp. TW-R-39-2]|uniref:hypothetical protein n=1 Tax=Dechloromonas sp. TW-R-39-2 TaxID=2654218 RepID=UPI00193EA3F9|nr:hypothetical protein [Dechloromonas sp. TW-R-39-2]QRM18471.1 hypothetical protein GBK02_03195 [Dechloromonas sp. TW-R-39-2]
MNPLRHLLLVAVLFFAQLAAGAHAIDHAVDKEGALPNHVCELCLAAHDLGAALPSLTALPPVLAQYVRPEQLPHLGRTAFPPPLTRQRDPPVS